MVAYSYNLSYMGGEGRRIVVPGKKVRLYLKNKLKQEGLRAWLKGRALA
jgi:hypothetical protein